MKSIPEFLKSNDHHLKFCILYEVALKKPIFDSYRNFCDAVGPDAMEYRDFEFWYRRFCLGELDFDYDRSTDSVPKTLMNMPVKLVRKITENLTSSERSSLRFTNSDIKKLTDSLPRVLEKISITTTDEVMEWELNDREFKCERTSSGCTLSTLKNYKGFKIPQSYATIMQWELNDTIFECKKTAMGYSFFKQTIYKESYIKKSLEYLTPVFKLAKLRVNHLTLRRIQKRDSPYRQVEGTSDLDDLLSVPFHVKEVHISGYDVNRVTYFLSAMKPGHLESISLGFDGIWNIKSENFEEVFKTDQFKQAKEVSIDRYVELHMDDLVSFSHLKSFKCRLKNNIEIEEILKIPDIVSFFKKFESCFISSYIYKYPYIEHLVEALGAEIPEETMESIPEFLKSNDHHLKFCILYEVALKRPIFDSYRSFCEAVGQGAMEYPDFEFWYHRFRQGKLDFDYDRSMDPVPKDLMDMPVNLMRKITKELDPFERRSLRSTNRAIKELSDSLPSVFEEIHVTTSAKEIRWGLNEARFECRCNDTGCLFQKSKLYEECYIKKCLEYLTPVFKIPNIQVNYLYLRKMEEREHFFGERRKTPDLDELLSVPLHVKEVYISGYDVNRVIHFLSAMKPGHLKSISLGFDGMWSVRRENFEAIFETDQFKMVKEVTIDSNVEFHMEDLVNFSHLRSFECRLKDNMEPDEVLRIPDVSSAL
ncbi:unnamed protein product [Caenorhabditis nigoni]